MIFLYLILGSIFVAFLIAFALLYVIKNNKSKSNIQIALRYALLTFCATIFLLFIGFIINGLTFGLLLEGRFKFLPWVFKEHLHLSPLYLSLYVFLSLWSVLTLYDAIQSRKQKSIEVTPSKAEKSSISIFSTILAAILLGSILLLTINLYYQWRRDVEFLKEMNTSNAQTSNDSKYLRQLFNTIKSSHDDEIKNSWVLVSIANNSNADPALLNDIYHYEYETKINALTSKPENNTKKLKLLRLSAVLKSLAENPSTPNELMDKIVEAIPNLPSSEEQIQPSLAEPSQTQPNNDLSSQEFNFYITIVKNPNASPEQLRKIYKAILNKVNGLPLYSNKSQYKFTLGTLLLEELIKNPKTPIDILNDINSKSASDEGITELDFQLIQSPNLTDEIIKSVIEKSKKRLANPKNNIDQQEFQTLLSMATDLAKRKKLSPELIELLLSIPSCEIKQVVFSELSNGPQYPALLRLYVTTTNIEIQSLIDSLINQEKYARRTMNENLTVEEKDQVNQLSTKIKNINNPKELESLYDSISNRKILYAVLIPFLKSPMLSPDIAQKIYLYANENLSKADQSQIQNYLAYNKKTPAALLQSIAEKSMQEISSQHFEWIQTLGIAAANPNLPKELLVKIATYPHCFIRKSVATNPSLPIEVFEKMKEDEDYTVRSAAKNILRKD